MKVINLYGGPGSGKSTTAAELFAMMKLRGKNVELVTEAAKDVTWERNGSLLVDSLWILAEQNRRIYRLRQQVEYVITDSPLLTALAFTKGPYDAAWFEHAVHNLDAYYDNARYFIVRQKNYSTVGRNESEKEARLIDNRMETILEPYPYEYIKGDEEAAASIYRSLFPQETME